MKSSASTIQVRFFSCIPRGILWFVAICLFGGGWSRSVIAQTAAEISADAALAGRIQAFRALLLKKKNANEISADEYKREDYAADSIVIHLSEKYDYRGTITNTYLAQANQVSQAILANPAAHQAELDQAAADMEKEAGNVAQMNQEIIDEGKKLAAQPSPPAAQPPPRAALPQPPATLPPISGSNKAIQTSPAAISQPASHGAAFAVVVVVVLIGAGAFMLFRAQQAKGPKAVAYVPVKIPDEIPPPAPPPAAGDGQT